MTRDEKIKRIEDIEKELAELKESIEEEEENNQSCWKPKFRERYYYITNNGESSLDTWDDSLVDKIRLAIGNIFKTKAEADFAVERAKVIYELRMYAEPRGAKWDGDNEHYYISYTIYNSYKKRINVYFSSSYKHHDIYFSSFGRAWEAIKAVGEDRVKKYYLCVEEEQYDSRRN